MAAATRRTSATSCANFSSRSDGGIHLCPASIGQQKASRKTGHQADRLSRVEVCDVSLREGIRIWALA
jgi:hypothetical protein